MKRATYTVVPHLEVFRIAGLSGKAGLVTFRDQKVAEDVCAMLHAAYADGVRTLDRAIRDVLGPEGGRR